MVDGGIHGEPAVVFDGAECEAIPLEWARRLTLYQFPYLVRVRDDIVVMRNEIDCRGIDDPTGDGVIGFDGEPTEVSVVPPEEGVDGGGHGGVIKHVILIEGADIQPRRPDLRVLPTSCSPQILFLLM